MEEQLDLVHSTHTNVNKAVANLHKDQARLLARIHEGENVINEVENDIARTKVESLNVSTVNDSLQEQLSKCLCTSELANICTCVLFSAICCYLVACVRLYLASFCCRVDIRLSA